MKYAELKRMCEESLSGLSYDITDNILSGMEEDEEIEFDMFIDRVLEELDSYFTYYEDAWDYLQDNGITDFEDAFREWNVTDICGIACYYAHCEINDEVWNYWNEYEDSLESEEEDEDLEI